MRKLRVQRLLIERLNDESHISCWNVKGCAHVRVQYMESGATDQELMECWETRDLEVEFFQLIRPAFAFILMLIRFTQFIGRVTSYLFAKPARPRPKRTLGGTNCKADRAPVRSSMSSSCASSSSSPVAASGSDLSGAFLVLLLS